MVYPSLPEASIVYSNDGLADHSFNAIVYLLLNDSKSPHVQYPHFFLFFNRVTCFLVVYRIISMISQTRSG